MVIFQKTAISYSIIEEGKNMKTWIIDPKNNKASVSLTFATVGFIVASTVLIVSIILAITTKVIDASTVVALGATVVTYMSACFALYFGRRKNGTSTSMDDIKEIIKTLKTEVNSIEKGDK